MCGLKSQNNSSDMPAFRRENKQLLSRRSPKLLDEPTQALKLSVTLDLGSISNDQDLKPYWNDACQELQSALWLPQETGSLGQDSSSFAGQLSNTAGILSNWKLSLQRTTSTPRSLFVSLPVSSRATTEKEVTVARKVRVFPNDASQWDNLCGLHRVAYNTAIAAINSGRPDRRNSAERSEKNSGYAGQVTTRCSSALSATRRLTRRLIRYENALNDGKKVKKPNCDSVVVATCHKGLRCKDAQTADSCYLSC